MPSALVTPDALEGESTDRRHAIFSSAIVLIAMDDDLVADLPSSHLRPIAPTMPAASEPACDGILPLRREIGCRARPTRRCN